MMQKGVSVIADLLFCLRRDRSSAAGRPEPYTDAPLLQIGKRPGQHAFPYNLSLCYAYSLISVLVGKAFKYPFILLQQPVQFYFPVHLNQ